MKRFAKELKKYEVYFTTICTVLLSVMAIIVSVKSCEISERQYNMEYFEKQPEFYIVTKQIRNEETKQYEDNILEISKISGKAKNIEISTITFLDVVYYKNEANNFRRFLLSNYYQTSLLSDKADGLIETKIGDKNNKHAIELGNLLDERLEPNFHYIFPEVHTFVKIKYLNFENKSKTQYFNASFHKATLIDNDTMSKYFETKLPMFNSKNVIHLDSIQKIDIDKIIDQF